MYNDPIPEKQKEIKPQRSNNDKGLVKLRANYKTHTTLKHECSNCRCKRYNPCTCMKG